MPHRWCLRMSGEFKVCDSPGSNFCVKPDGLIAWMFVRNSKRDTGIRIYWKKKCRKYHRLMALVDPFSLVRQPTRPGGFLPHFPAAGPVYAAIPAQHRLHSELWLEHRWKDCHHPTAGLGPERPPAPRWYRMGWWHSGWALAPMKDVLASLLWCRWVPATSRSNAYGVQDSMLWKRYS